MTDKKKFTPKCLYGTRAAGFTATGFLVPCCWVDCLEGWNDEQLKKFYDKKLHIDNNEVEEIFESETWTDWFDMLKNNPENAPKLCKKYCTIELDKYVTRKREIVND